MRHASSDSLRGKRNLVVKAWGKLDEKSLVIKTDNVDTLTDSDSSLHAFVVRTALTTNRETTENSPIAKPKKVDRSKLREIYQAK